MNAREFMTRRARPRMVIFDCDGVLVDSEPVANRVTAELITLAGWPLTAEEAERRFVGLNLEAMVPLIEEHLGHKLPPDWVARLTDQLVVTLGRECTAIPGAIATVEAVCKMGLAWRVASNSSHAEMDAKFACIGATALFIGRLHSYTDVLRGKPAPDLFLSAANAAGIPPADCIVIEDSAPGARAAAAAGMDCLGYAPKGDNAALRAEKAHLFGAMSKLPALIGLAGRK